MQPEAPSGLPAGRTKKKRKKRKIGRGWCSCQAPTLPSSSSNGRLRVEADRPGTLDLVLCPLHPPERCGRESVDVERGLAHPHRASCPSSLSARPCTPPTHPSCILGAFLWPGTWHLTLASPDQPRAVDRVPSTDFYWEDKKKKRKKERSPPEEGKTKPEKLISSLLSLFFFSHIFPCPFCLGFIAFPPSYSTSFVE